MDKLKMQAKPMDVVLKKVMEICPAAVQNGKVNFDRLREELSDAVDDSIKESYDFTWVGKRAAIVEANKPINKTLRPAKDESKNWDTTENLYIEGDNLEVLKLLQESYLNKVKMIYIDPPYNTGKDFVYKDNFKQSKEDEAEGLGLYDDEGNKMFKNTETNGRFHSDWCSMMYPRLKLARDFLTDDGVIFISIDDNEVANLRKICDEVFGEDNFVAEFVWQKKSSGGQHANFVLDFHEYILCYSKNIGQISELLIKRSEKQISSFTLIDEHEEERGKHLLSPLKSWLDYRPTLIYDIICPDDTKINTQWVCATETYEKLKLEGRIVFKKNKNNEWSVYKKQYEKENGGLVKPSSIITEYGQTQNGKKDIKELFDGNDVMSFPKPVILIKYLITLLQDKDATILDFFSGSATTAHAVMQLNADDGGQRKFIMVQLPEITDKDSEAAKAGYKNICEIGKERIRRAGEKIKADTGLMAKDLDVGFRVLKLADSNMQDVYYTPADISKKTLLDSVDNIKNDRKPLDLLFGVMVDWGVSLSLPLAEHKVGNNTIYVVGDNDLVACFDTNVTPDTITKMAAFNPTRAVFRDSCFAKDDAKINMMEIFKATCGWDEKQAKDSVKVI